jgi:hypothetical protein
MKRRRTARPLSPWSMSDLAYQVLSDHCCAAKSERSGLICTSRCGIESLHRVRPNSEHQQREQLAMQKGLAAFVSPVLHGRDGAQSRAGSRLANDG